jgi:hypothetical protein
MKLIYEPNMQQNLSYVKSIPFAIDDTFNARLCQNLDNFVWNLCCILEKFYVGLSSRTRRWMDPTSLYVLKKTKEPRSKSRFLMFVITIHLSKIQVLNAL